MFMLQYHFAGSFLASTFPRRRLHCVMWCGGGGGGGVEYISMDHWRMHMIRWCSICIGLSSVVCVKAIMKTEGYI